MSDTKTIAVVSTGVIGAGWATRCLARGLNVIATDPGPDAEKKLRDAINVAWPSVSGLHMAPGEEPGTLRFVETVEEAVTGADFIQESAPEREDLKRELIARIDAVAPADVIIASSSSGLLPSAIQADCAHPERVVIGHPFNPVYLLPLVEIVPGSKTASETVDRAAAFYENIGMYALKVRKEIEGYLSDRLQEAVWREILHLVNDGVATTRELDDAIIYGPGLRWALMGTCLTFHLAGGENGMRHMLEQFGPALKLPWTKLEAPELNDTLIDRMVEGTREQAAGRSIAELERLRNDCLAGIMQVLRQHGIGAGEVLARDETRRLRAAAPEPWRDGADIACPLRFHTCRVEPQWIDCNGHMSEGFHLHAFGNASETLFRYIGIDEDYRAAGTSFHTVETHLSFLGAAGAGDPLSFTTQLLGLDDTRLHIFHRMYDQHSGKLLCTAEQMLLHVDMTSQKAAPIRPDVHAALSAIMEKHRGMAPPEQVGRVMNVPDKGGKS